MADDITQPLPSSPKPKAAGGKTAEKTTVDEAATSAAPMASVPQAERAASVAPGASPEEGDRSGIFTGLVKADTDVVGLVAYSIYKQNKHDWLVAFRRQRGRDPDDAEVSAYILGEGTARRLATYRHLATATIDGTGPEVSFAEGSEGRARTIVRPRQTSSGAAGLPTWAQIALGVIALIVIFLAARYGIPGIERAG